MLIFFKGKTSFSLWKLIFFYRISKKWILLFGLKDL
jgi:hypothetical protein